MPAKKIVVTHTATCPMCGKKYTSEDEQEVIAKARACYKQGRPKYKYPIGAELPWENNLVVRVIKHSLTKVRGTHAPDYRLQLYRGDRKISTPFWKVENVLTNESAAHARRNAKRS